MFELPWWKIELTTAEHVLPQCVCDTGVSFCLPSLSVGSNKSHGGKLCGIIFNGAVWQVQPICSTVIICFEPSKMFILSEMNMSLICPKTYQIIRDILNLMDFPSKTNAPVGCFGPSPSKSVVFWSPIWGPPFRLARRTRFDSCTDRRWKERQMGQIWGALLKLFLWGTNGAPRNGVGSEP